MYTRQGTVLPEVEGGPRSPFASLRARLYVVLPLLVLAAIGSFVEGRMGWAIFFVCALALAVLALRGADRALPAGEPNIAVVGILFPLQLDRLDELLGALDRGVREVVIVLLGSAAEREPEPRGSVGGASDRDAAHAHTLARCLARAGHPARVVSRRGVDPAAALLEVARTVRARSVVAFAAEAWTPEDQRARVAEAWRSAGSRPDGLAVRLVGASRDADVCFRLASGLPDPLPAVASSGPVVGDRVGPTTT
jgi:hypothetical protein